MYSTKSGEIFDLKNKLIKKEILKNSTWFLNKADFQTSFLILQFIHKFYHWIPKRSMKTLKDVDIFGIPTFVMFLFFFLSYTCKYSQSKQKFHHKTLLKEKKVV